MDFDHKSLSKYITCIVGGAAAGAVGMYKITDYFADVAEASKFIEYSLEGMATLIGLGAGRKIGEWYYDKGMRGVVDKFYPISGAFLGARGGFELAEMVAENLEFSRGETNALEWVVTLIGGMSGIIAGRKIRKSIAENAAKWTEKSIGLVTDIMAGKKIRKSISNYNKKNKTTPVP